MRVLFVSGIDGFCHRYQVLHRAAQLAALGATSTVRHFADPRLQDDVAAHDVLFLYRVPETAAVAALLELAGKLGLPRLAAIDDLIFVDEPSMLPPLDGLAPAARAEWRQGVRRYRATIERCDAFVAPTEPLVEVARELGWRSSLHRNALAPAELELGLRARRARDRVRRDGVVLGYFSGTSTHDQDFASIAPALRGVLGQHPAARLLLVGPLELPHALASFADRIERRPLVAWPDLPALIASSDVCLAPLASDRPFAAAKGEIKYLEAAAVGVPTVASPTRAYRHAIRDGENGRLASSTEEWRSALSDLVAEPDLRERLGAAALADATERYAEVPRGRELLAVLEEVRAQTGRRAQTPYTTRAERFDVERPSRIALEPDACPALPEAVPAGVSPPLLGGSKITQRLRPSCNGLLRVDLRTVTYGQDLAHELHLSLRREDGVLVARASIAAADAPDRAFLALELDAPEGRSREYTYVLEVRAAGERAASALSFALTEDFHCDGAAGLLAAAEIDGEPCSGALVLRAFARWQDALAVESASTAGTSRYPASPDGIAAGGRPVDELGAQAETSRP